MKKILQFVLTLIISAAPILSHASSFEESSKYIDLDGTLVGYLDFDGDGQQIGTALNNIYQELLASTPDMPPIPVDYNLLLENLGFGSIRAVAFSSKELEPGLHRNRSVALLNGEPTGLFGLYGTESSTFTAAEKAPADATGAITATFQLSVLRDTMVKVLTQILGPMGEGMAQQQLTQPIPGSDVTVDEAIQALSGKWDAFWYQSYGENFEQTFKFWASIDHAGTLLPRLQALAEKQGVVFTEDEKGLTADFSNLTGEDAPFGLYITAPKESDQLILYSHKDWTAESVGPRLSDSPEFIKLAERLPEEALNFTYSVGSDMTPLYQMLEANPQTAQYQNVASSIINLVLGDYLKPTMGASILKENVLVGEQYAGYSTKQVIMILPVAIGTGLGAAMAIPAFQKVRTTSQEKAITNNLRQIASAADQYFLENGVNEVSFEQLEGDYFKNITPVAGESYQGMMINSDMQAISVTLPSGEVIEYTF